MSGEIRAVDPAMLDDRRPVADLSVRTPFAFDDAVMLLASVEPGERTGWHRHAGDLYGYVRAGEGRIEYGDDGSRAAVGSGEFVHVPAGLVHRLRTDEGPLEVVAVVHGSDAVEPADPPESTPNAPPRVAGPDDLVSTVETPELTRETPFPGEPVMTMRVRAAGGAAAGWHHHGDNRYFGYVVDGRSETEYGPGGERVAEVHGGECFTVPKGLVHRDTNPTDERHEGIIWLVGGEPWVVNVDGPRD